MTKMQYKGLCVNATVLFPDKLRDAIGLPGSQAVPFHLSLPEFLEAPRETGIPRKVLYVVLYCFFMAKTSS